MFTNKKIGSESKKSFQNNCLKKKQNQEKNSENKENSMVPISENSFNEIAEKNILQEKKLNDNRSNIIQNPIIKKQEIYAIVKFDFSPKKVLKF